jgi:hypothetical protein
MLAPRTDAWQHSMATPNEGNNRTNWSIAVLHDKNVNIAPEPRIIGLQALGFVAGDPDLGPRFLALSGIDAATLRARAMEPSLLAALIDFLQARESDLVACADALAIKPDAIVRAGLALSEGTA